MKDSLITAGMEHELKEAAARRYHEYIKEGYTHTVAIQCVGEDMREDVRTILNFWAFEFLNKKL